MRIAVPCIGPQVAEHFGHASQFTIFTVDRHNQVIEHEDVLDSPPHQPGLLPAWLHEQKADMILAGGMGSRARMLFDEHGIQVVIGIQAPSAREAVQAFLEGKLEEGDNFCDH